VIVDRVTDPLLRGHETLHFVLAAWCRLGLAGGRRGCAESLGDQADALQRGQSRRVRAHGACAL